MPDGKEENRRKSGSFLIEKQFFPFMVDRNYAVFYYYVRRYIDTHNRCVKRGFL